MGQDCYSTVENLMQHLIGLSSNSSLVTVEVVDLEGIWGFRLPPPTPTRASSWCGRND